MNCLLCNKDFKGWNKKAKYCSQDCSSKSRKLDFKTLIEAGKPVWRKHYRTYLIEKYGAKCMECGWDKINPKTGKCLIEIEHIDGNSDNNSLDNLKLLCPNCHSLTPTYKGLNKGNGRFIRRKRYQEGKSF